VPEDANARQTLVTVRLDPDETSTGAAARKLGLREEDVDREYGVVSIDPDANLYAVRVTRDAVGRVRPEGAEGIYSDPEIEPL
jgi:hypothetical protein